MVKKQQMQWKLKGAHRALQVRAAVLNGDLSERLAWQSPKPTHRYRLAWMFEPTLPLLKPHETQLTYGPPRLREFLRPAFFSLLQRIRLWSKAPSQDGDPRSPVLII